MFKISITDNASYKLDNFINSYFKVSINLFTDCWIEDSSIIKKNYIKESDNFKDDIYINLSKNLSLYEILLKRRLRENYNSTVISLRNWNLFVYYTEDEEQKIRFIEDIEFNRR